MQPQGDHRAGHLASLPAPARPAEICRQENSFWKTVRGEMWPSFIRNVSWALLFFCAFVSTRNLMSRKSSCLRSELRCYGACERERNSVWNITHFPQHYMIAHAIFSDPFENNLQKNKFQVTKEKDKTEAIGTQLSIVSLHVIIKWQVWGTWENNKVKRQFMTCKRWNTQKRLSDYILTPVVTRFTQCRQITEQGNWGS